MTRGVDARDDTKKGVQTSKEVGQEIRWVVTTDMASMVWEGVE